MGSAWSPFEVVIRSRRGRVAIMAAALIGSGSCNELVTQGRASSFLVIERLSGASGADPSAFTTVLQSDVVTHVRRTVDGQPVSVPTIFEDPGQVIMRLGLKDPGTPSTPSSPTSANWITVTRYRVVFRRSDGRNTPGVDVPHAFDGAVSVTVMDIASATFTLVRGQAKLEPPLIALRDGGGAIAISAIAEVTFYGQDQTGAEVSVTGSISVNFGDWDDLE
jgi:hypothetical protein